MPTNTFSRCILTLLLLTTLLTTGYSQSNNLVVKRASKGQEVKASNGQLTIKCVGKRQNYDYRDTASLDKDILSPKSVSFHPDGSRYYVNSLEGGLTVVYDAASGRKLKTIVHRLESGEGPLWNTPSPYYRFTHYSDGQQRAFWGKPVESTFSHDGRYLWIPYYRRSFDLNAQDPSAIAIIDTRCDSIVRMMETGPLPKMITCSHDNKLIAVTHWGNNTVGLIDISNPDPKQWHHLQPVVIGTELKLDFSTTQPVDRDKESGLKLRGTTFTPDDRYLLVGCMGGGGIAVIDVSQRTYLGIIGDIYNARHLITGHGYLYASINVAGLVKRVPLDSVTSAINRRQGKSIKVNGWETCKVDPGARTIELSPSGNFLFAACNVASALNVVDTRTMKVIATITVDSYPVGLDVSSDGTMVVTTSQGRKGTGGNAVNLFSVTYADPQAEKPAPAIIEQQAEEEAASAEQQQQENTGFVWQPWMYYALIAVGILFIIGLAWFMSHRD